MYDRCVSSKPPSWPASVLLVPAAAPKGPRERPTVGAPPPCIMGHGGHQSGDGPSAHTPPLAGALLRPRRHMRDYWHRRSREARGFLKPSPKAPHTNTHTSGRDTHSPNKNLQHKHIDALLDLCCVDLCSCLRTHCSMWVGRRRTFHHVTVAIILTSRQLEQTHISYQLPNIPKHSPNIPKHLPKHSKTFSNFLQNNCAGLDYFFP